MKKISIGILAHVDSGKTTLSEALLYTSGMIKNQGRVDNKDAFLDTFEIEKSRGITIFSKIARLNYKDMEISLVDTPGHTDFSAEMERTLAILDYAILVVSASSGVQSHTKTLWRLLENYKIPTFIFINKVDQAGVNVANVIKQLKTDLDSRIINFNVGNEDTFFDEIAMCSENLMNEYLEKGVVSNESIINSIAEREVFPCSFGSALKLRGVEDLLDLLNIYTLDYKVLNDIGNVYEKDNYRFYVYKITRDKGVRLTHIRLINGSLSPKAFAGEEKIDQIRLYNGNKFETKNIIYEGEIATLTGLDKTYAGQIVSSSNEQINTRFDFRFYQKLYLEPVLNYEIILENENDIYLFMGGLKQIGEEIPEIGIVWNEKTQKINVKLMGQVQIEILQNIIREMLGTEVNFSKGSIIYKETLTNSIEGVGHFEPLKHYAEVHLLIEPLKKGSGLKFETTALEDDISSNWQNQVMGVLYSKAYSGVLGGFELTDLRISLITGKNHIKHTSGGDFKEATIRAIRHGLLWSFERGEVELLEPFYNFRLEIPSANLGRALNDLNLMFAEFNAPEILEENAFILGKAPAACMQNYQEEVLSYSKGLGNISLSFSGYEKCHNTQEVIESTLYNPQSDLDNPAFSVFCSHGNSFIVPWYEVHRYMHVDSGLGYFDFKEIDENVEVNVVKSTYDQSKADSEELMAIFERTYGKVKPRIGDWDKPISKPKPEKPYIFKETKLLREFILVDGYNVIFAWKELAEIANINIDSAREKLLEILSNYQVFKAVDMILVFDAYRLKGHKTEIIEYDTGKVSKYIKNSEESVDLENKKKLYIVYTKEAETADRYIEKTAHELGRKCKVTVVTSDNMEQVIIRSQGCLLMSALEFYEEVKKTEKDIRENIDYSNSTQTRKSYLLDGIDEEELKKLREKFSQN